MIAHSNTFKNAIIRLGRDIHIRVEYYSIVYNLATEDDKLIITQDNMELLTEPIEGLTPSGLLSDEEIMSLNRNNLGELFRTYMKSFDLETSHRFNVGDKMNISVGTSIGEDTIEYLKYGKYFVYKRTYNEDTRTYTYTLCDSMLFTMIPYDNDAVFEDDDEIDCETAINRILTICNLDANISSLVNGDKIIYKETFEGADMTYRDVLDMIMQSQGCSLLISYDDEQDKDIVITKSFSSQSVDTIDEDVLADKNVKTGVKFGRINSLLFKRANGNDNIEKKDEQSILNDGLCQYIIENNYILDQENRQDYIDNLFNKIKNVEYYTCNIDLIGLGYIEYMDTFEIHTQDGIYKCLCLKNTSNISNGMNENFTTESPVEKKQEYGSLPLSDKDAQILVNKLKGEIVLKTNSDGKIAQVRLDSSGDDGSLVEISGDQVNITANDIHLEGYTTINEHFSIDGNGDMECTNATINGTIKGSTFKGNNNNSVYCHIGYDSAGSGSTDNCFEIIGNDNTQLLGIYGKYWDSSSLKSVYFVSSANNFVFLDGIVRASQFIDSSTKEKKKDFERFDKGLEIINNIDIYKYRYKTENEDVKKHIGLVIGKDYKYSKEVTNNDNDGVDLYSFISVCCKAIQEQQEQIEELKKEINNLKGGNK